jgi:hypothetical protein
LILGFWKEPGRYGGIVAAERTPDDIKIIAQFLAERGGEGSAWPAYTTEAFKLRQQLKQRGGYKLARTSTGSAPARR